ncbi:MAG: glycosyltransferase family A protein [Parvibaculum sp.]|nr:glycosyltransferase family A protein [Parvibaculum sp.]
MGVAVILTCHNEAEYIEQAVRSVAAQTLIDQIDSVIVVNDGSSDNSAEILDGLVAEIPQLVVITESGIGLPAARNRAIQASAGEFIAFLDGDDYWVPEKLEKQMPAFKDRRVGLVYCDYVDFTRADASDAQDIYVRPYDVDMERTLETYFVHDAPIVPSSCIIRRETFEDVGLFDPEMRLGEDTEMFLRVAEKWRFQYVPGAMIFKRRHGRNLTRRLDALLPVSEVVTDRFVRRNPQLEAFACKRRARRLARAGNDCARQGEFRIGVGYILRAIGNDPVFWRSYAYLMLALAPQRITSSLRDAIRFVFYKVHSRRSL